MPTINENGVYIGEDIPRCSFEKNMHRLHISLLEVEGGFIVGSSVMLPNIGHAYGLSINNKVYETKLLALKDALGNIERRYESHISASMLEQFKQRLETTFKVNFDNQLVLF